MKKWSAIIAAFIVALTIIFTGCSFSFSTANIKDAHMTTAVGDDGKPTDTVTTYATDASKLVAVAILANAPSDTKVKFVWYTQNQKFLEYPLDPQGRSDVYISCTFTPDSAVPAGDYKVEIYVDERDKPDVTINFTVK